jgi:RimJ/RimL family protein N-acetyltransferase
MNKMKKTGKNGIGKDARVLPWTAARAPEPIELTGHHVFLRPLVAESDARPLWSAFAEDREGEGWTWLPYGPFATAEAFREWLQGLESGADPLFMSILPKAGGNAASGMAAFMRSEPAHGVIEIGHIHLSPALQRTTAATEALYLMMRACFESWGYRRLEWKCDTENRPSRRAAERLGFRFEGIFRQHLIVKGRNRDTAWYSIIDGEWPRIRAAFDAWLDPRNFDSQGKQRKSLQALREGLRSGGQRL